MKQIESKIIEKACYFRRLTRQFEKYKDDLNSFKDSTTKKEMVDKMLANKEALELESKSMEAISELFALLDEYEVMQGRSLE